MYEVDVIFGTIAPVEVLKVTDNSVKLPNGRTVERVSKVYRSYFPSWEEGHAHMLACADMNCERARKALAKAERTFNAVLGMTKP